MSGWPSGYGRRTLDEVDSTNAEGLRLADGLAGPEWILGLRQTRGRGRRGRAWEDPPGNFAATLVMRPKGAASEAALRSFVAALALFEALEAVTGRPEALALKWPNDVLLNGGKVAGILLESAGQGGGVAHLAIGIGVNLRHVPEVRRLEDGALSPVAVAGETGVLVEPEAFLDVLAPAFARWEARFATFGFAPVREAWLARAARLGEVITARTAQTVHTGTFETIDADGNLVLRRQDGTISLPAAEIFF